MSTSFEVTGTIHEIMDTTQITDTFKKREFVLEVPEKDYPQHVKFQAVQDKTTALDGLHKGQTVTVRFNLKGRPYQRKDGSTDYWLNLDAWQITPKQGGKAEPAPVTSQEKVDFDDVPF